MSERKEREDDVMASIEVEELLSKAKALGLVSFGEMHDRTGTGTISRAGVWRREPITEKERRLVEEIKNLVRPPDFTEEQGAVDFKY